MSWLTQAACAGISADLFYPASAGDRSTIVAAKRVCGECPVRAECLRHALETVEPHGIWGGLTEWERAKLPQRQTGHRHDYADCGTPRAHRAHLRRGEKPCLACRVAYARDRRNRNLRRRTTK